VLGHRADNKTIHPPEKKTGVFVRNEIEVEDAVKAASARNVIEHVAVTEVSLDDIPAYKEPGLVLVPIIKHLGVYSTMMTVIQRVTSGELREDAAKDILIALTKCL
jgi:hypothetical protein